MFNKVLFPLDGSPESARILNYIGALPLAETVDVHLLGVTTGTEERSRLKTHLEQKARILGEDGYQVTCHLANGDAADAIANVAERHHVDALCMFTHARHGFTRLLSGSVTETVIRHIHCPVIGINETALGVLDQQPGGGVKNLLVPLDGDPREEEIVAMTRELGRDMNVILFHDELGIGEQDNRGESAELRKILLETKQNLARVGVGAEVASSSLTHPAKAILEQAASTKNCTILMGSHGRSGMGLGLFGSTAVEVLRAATCPVIILRYDIPQSDKADDPFVNG